MHITKNKDNELEITTKKALIKLGDKVFINDVELEGEGEYEVSRVAIEGVDDSIYLITAEDVQMGLVDFKGKISKEKSEKLSDVSVLVAKLNGEIGDTIDQVNQIEPSVVVFFGTEEMKAGIRSGGFSVEEVEEVKISKADIEEGQSSYFINSNGKTV